jgi:hypothetical protein
MLEPKTLAAAGRAGEAVRYPVAMDHGSLLRIVDGKGLPVEATAGLLWITQERDLRDIIVAAGQSFRLDRNGVALVYALGASGVAVCAPPGVHELPEPAARSVLLRVTEICPGLALDGAGARQGRALSPCGPQDRPHRSVDAHQGAGTARASILVDPVSCARTRAANALRRR